jgi:hypothetical protein
MDAKLLEELPPLLLGAGCLSLALKEDKQSH